jgi:hypothetical protein
VTLIIWKLKFTFLQQHLPVFSIFINGKFSSGSTENEVDPLRSLLLNKYNTYCPFVEFIQIGNLNVSMRIMIDFSEQKITS